MLRLLFLPLLLLLTVIGAGRAATPGWVEDAVVYGVIPKLLGPRGLAEVTDRLDAIASLGATVIWLSPITDAPPGDFGYAVTDHFHIRADLGTEDDLRALVRGAHRRHLRVILDVAANDLADRHPFYQDVLRRGRESPYWNFFDRDQAGTVTHYFDWVNLENLNYGDEGVRGYMTEAFTHWLREFDIDGFRVDAAWGPRQRTPGFWPGWVTRMRETKTDILLLAEASARDPYYAAAGFDAAYDWTDQPGEWAWHQAFAAEAPARELRRALAAENGAVSPFRFIDNNDTGARFISRYGSGTLRVALAMLMTLPGVPCLYMGDEVGAAFEPYRAAQALDWTDAHHLRGYVEQLIRLRHAQAALRGREMRLVTTSRDDVVLAYLRPGLLPAESALVVLNYGASRLDVTLAPSAVAALTGPGALVDLVSGAPIEVDPRKPSLVLPPLTARILSRAVKD